MSEYDRLKAMKDEILDRQRKAMEDEILERLRKQMSNQEQPTSTFESWALVELMGHQRIVGKASEVTHFGTPLLRIDVPAQGDEDAYTKFYGGGAIYCITPITEAVAMRMLANVRPNPVPRWDLRPPIALLGISDRDDDEEEFELARRKILKDEAEMDGDSSGTEEDPT
jgi:hypothetical protein